MMRVFVATARDDVEHRSHSKRCAALNLGAPHWPKRSHIAQVNLDAGAWAPNRSADGEILADTSKFPQGMGAVAAAIHRRGLKFGMYTDLSNRAAGKVCGTGPGSFGSFAKDANTFAKIGIDFLKVDYCAYDQTDSARFHPPIMTQLEPWQQLRDALNATGRPIYRWVPVLKMALMRSALQHSILAL